MAILRKQAPREIKQFINTADIETDENGELLDIGLFMGETGQYLVFSNWSDFINEIAAYADNTIIWFHNGGKFDVVNLLYYIAKDKVYGLAPKACTCMMVAGRILQMKLHTESGATIILRDSLALLPKGLDALTKTFCDTTFKEKVPDEYKSDMGRYKNDYPIEYYTYLNHDVLSLHEVLSKFRAYINDISPIGDLPVSVASLAMKVFLTSFMEHEIEIHGERENEIARDSYRGGRCEAVGDGQKETVKHDGKTYNFFGGVTGIDVNSMYPKQMRDCLFPTTPGVKVYELIYNDAGEVDHGLYYCEYNQQGGKYPAILGMDLETGKLSCERWGEAWLTHHEVNALLKYDADVFCYHGIYYENVEPIFKGFVEHFYSLRMDASKRGDAALTEICKLLLNNLYGKFAQRIETEEILIMTMDEGLNWEPPKNSNSEIRLYSELEGGEYAAFIVSGETAIHTRNAIPAIASFVTAAARCHLHDLMEQIGGVLYCDTDSIFTQNAIPTDLLDHYELGKSKIEYENAYMDVRGRKMYALYDSDMQVIKKRSKGVGAGSVPDFMTDTFTGINVRPTSPKSFIQKSEISPSKFKETERSITRQKTTFDKNSI